MGDMADMAIGDIMDHDDYFWGEDTLEGYGGGGGRQPQCKYCGSTKVGWRVDEANRWRMINLADHKPHTCKEYYDKHRPRSYYTGRELVLTEPLLGTKRNSHVPYLDWAISIV